MRAPPACGATSASVPLRPKSFDVLLYLVRNRGRLVTKDELFENVWANVIVTDNSLVQCIKEIRQALGRRRADDDRNRRQARLRLHARRRRNATMARSRRTPVAVPVEIGVRAMPAPRRRFRRTRWRWLRHRRRHRRWRSSSRADCGGRRARWRAPQQPARGLDCRPPGRKPPVRRGAAVRRPRARPPTTISRSASAKTSQPRSAAFPISPSPRRRSSRDSAASARSADDIQRQLKVRYLVEGSVRRSPERIRIAVRLTDLPRGMLLWSESYDASAATIFAIEDDIIDQDRRRFGGEADQSPADLAWPANRPATWRRMISSCAGASC